MNSEKLRVITREKELIMVDQKITIFCRTFSKLLEGPLLKKNNDLISLKKYLDSSPTEDIPIDVDSKIFKIILGFLENHNYQPIKELPKPLQTKDVSKFVSEYDDQLMLSLNDDEKYALILVRIQKTSSNYF